MSSPVRDSEKLAPAPWETIFDVYRAFRVKSKFFFGVLSYSQVILRNAKAAIPIPNLFLPFFKGLGSGVFRNKIFDFHLLKLAGAECEVARSDFIAECFANLRDSKRQS